MGYDVITLHPVGDCISEHSIVARYFLFEINIQWVLKHDSFSGFEVRMLQFFRTIYRDCRVLLLLQDGGECPYGVLR